MRSAVRILLALFCCIFSAAASTNSDVYFVRDFGALGDGTNDDTPAFQKALDTASQAGGGTVMADRGNYFFAGHLNVPKSVCLQGMWKSVTSHIGLRNHGPASKPTDDGTTFLVTESAGNEDGPPFIRLNENSTLSGVVIYYPLQKTDQDPAPYPWSVVLRSRNCAVLDVELLNSYNGIDATGGDRHLIRNISGQPLRRGIFVDRIFDIGRIENVHFNPWWSLGTPVYKWQLANGEAFVFARSDWEYVLDTFCFGYKVGYKFIHTREGECNGNFLGIGADDCFTAVDVEQAAPYGILINNGEFTSFHGPDPTMVVVGSTNRGVVRFSNCAFWGPCNQIAKIEGRGTVGFSDCTFCEWDHANEGRSALQVDGSASVIVHGCEFQANKAQIEFGANVMRAVFSDNLIRGKLRVTNHSSKTFNIHDNASNEAEK